MAVVLSMNAVSPPPAPACGLEVVRPETGPRRDGFMAWLATHAAELGGEVAARAAADSLGSFELRIADLDNDGAEDYVLTAHVGSGGYLDLYLFRRAGEGWALAQDSPLDQDPMVGANDYDDRASDQRQVLVRFCGRTFLTLLGGTAPNWSREAWMWKGGTFHRVCDADWLAEQRREFQRLFDLAQYDAAHGFLDGVQASCKKEAAPETWLWMQSDLALAAYRVGTYADCLEHVAAAEQSSQFATAGASLRKAVATSARLCRAAKGTIAPVDFAWLRDVKTDPPEQVVLDPRFDRLLTAIVPDAKVDGEALRDLVKQNLYLPETVRVVDRRYVVLAGCRPHDCENKGFAWIDTVGGKSLVAVNGLIASTSLEPGAIPPEVWTGIAEVVGFADEQALTFVGRDGRTREIKAPAR